MEFAYEGRKSLRVIFLALFVPVFCFPPGAAAQKLRIGYLHVFHETPAALKRSIDFMKQSPGEASRVLAPASCPPAK
jgi:hypothetical protein